MLARTISTVLQNRQNSRSFASSVTSAMVKQLRDKSNAPMMDCKKALAAEDGDMEKALSWLRTRGVAKIAGAQGRVSSEGLVCLATSEKFVTLLELNSETDFVAMNKDFQNFMLTVSATISEKYATTKGPIAVEELLSASVPGSSKTVQDHLDDLVSIIREKILIKRAENFSGGVLAGYVHGKVGTEHVPAHVQLGKQAVVVSIDVDSDDIGVLEKVQEMGKRLAMHTAAAKPKYLSVKEVPQDVLDSEMAIFREQVKDDIGKKKPEIIEKIIQGKLKKRMSELTLLGQAHMVEEGGPEVEKFIKSMSSSLKTPISVASFAYWQVGDNS